MNETTLSDLKIWFTEYVHTFNFSNPDLQRNIDLKEEHTKQVCYDIILIGKELGLNDNELRFSEIIALFHDLGRFEQYARYRTFLDSKSEDHAELGIKTLQKHNVLNQFDDELKNLILSSIRYHNQPALPKNESQTCLFYTKLLRDADKLDIWRVVIDYYNRKNGKKNDTISLDLPDTPGISEKVYWDIIHKKTVNIKDVNNINDLKLLQTGWIFDINFKPTADYIKSHRYLEKMREVIPESNEIEEIFKVIHTFCVELESIPLPDNVTG
ncbi:MAG: HD domain-containing protein [Bacteroidales bacterium]|nr:HD domain-containing protein [Bacteroidales bacterium]